MLDISDCDWAVVLRRQVRMQTLFAYDDKYDEKRVDCRWAYHSASLTLLFPTLGSGCLWSTNPFILQYPV